MNPKTNGFFFAFVFIFDHFPLLKRIIQSLLLFSLTIKIDFMCTISHSKMRFSIQYKFIF